MIDLIDLLVGWASDRYDDDDESVTIWKEAAWTLTLEDLQWISGCLVSQMK